ncbi:MAG: type II secretion system F family protein [Candidatus Omnitrophica bacterium]|nr:type II secretion system F family protein [Candidatus Omnitrophota bacterium]
MPNFRYKIRDKYGRASKGTIEGESRDSVARHLKKMGYTPTVIKEQSSAFKKYNPFEKLFRRVNMEELIVFTRQLMTLQHAGVPILVSLESIREQSTNAYFKDVIGEITRDIESGKSLSESISKFTNIFSEVYINMLRAGEAAGILDNVLDRLANLLEQEHDLNMKIKQATRYPLLVLLTISIAFPLVVMFIIPKFSVLFMRFNTQLPLPTRVLLGLNFVLVHYWMFIIIGIVFLVGAFRYFINSKVGRPLWDSLKLKTPIFGLLILKISMSRFSRLTSVLSASGISIIDTLYIVKDAIGNRIIANSVENIIEGVKEGKGLAEPMKVSGLFPSIIVQMVKIGEETGKIDELLLRVSDYYDSQISYTVKNLTVLIEPVLIFVMGIMVLVLALAIFMPIWNLITLFRH